MISSSDHSSGRRRRDLGCRLGIGRGDRRLLLLRRFVGLAGAPVLPRSPPCCCGACRAILRAPRGHLQQRVWVVAFVAEGDFGPRARGPASGGASGIGTGLARTSSMGALAAVAGQGGAGAIGQQPEKRDPYDGGDGEILQTRIRGPSRGWRAVLRKTPTTNHALTANPAARSACHQGGFGLWWNHGCWSWAVPPRSSETLRRTDAFRNAGDAARRFSSSARRACA